MLKVIVLIL